MRSVIFLTSASLFTLFTDCFCHYSRARLKHDFNVNEDLIFETFYILKKGISLRLSAVLLLNHYKSML